MAELKMWWKDNEHCEKVILDGEEVEVKESRYGGNDFVIEFLIRSGLMKTMERMYPNYLKQDNGKSWIALNRVQIIRELMKVGRIAKVGKVIHDSSLIAVCGFNLEEIEKKAKEEKGVMIPETLSNHLNRIDKESCMYTFYDQVQYIRSKKWIRRKTYVADAHEIIIQYGRKFEELGKTGKKYGYKLVILMNIEEGRERVIGFALGPLQIGERELLLDIFHRLEEAVAPIKEIIDLIILDRGYWGANFLRLLKKKYKIDFVTRVRDHSLDVAQDVEGLIKLKGTEWQRIVENKKRQGKKMQIEVEYTGIEDLWLEDKEKKTKLRVNAVACNEYDMEGNLLLDKNNNEEENEEDEEEKTEEEKQQERKKKEEEQGHIIYITSLGVSHPYRIRRFYLRRWFIENQGFRCLTQRWNLDIPAGRKINIIRARICFVLMLYNAEAIMEMKFPEEWQKEKERLEQWGEEGMLGKPALIIYTRDYRCGIFTGKRYGELVAQASRIKYEKHLRQQLQEAVEKGINLEEFTKRLDTS